MARTSRDGGEYQPQSHTPDMPVPLWGGSTLAHCTPDRPIYKVAHQSDLLTSTPMASHEDIGRTDP